MLLRTLFRLALGARPPIVDGELALDGLEGPLTIRRDDNGVPYVEASTDHDAFFGIGFCQAQDRAFQLELLVRIVRGTLAEIVGPEMLDVDRLSRRIDFCGIADAQLACSDDATRAQLAAFARGVNAGLTRGAKKKAHELTLLGIEPSTYLARDTIAVVQFLAFALSSNWDAELARLRVLRADGVEALVALEASLAAWRLDLAIADRLVADADVLAAAEALVRPAAALEPISARGGASNAWAIAPSRTTTGRPIVAGDPHLSPALPAPWYLAHARTPSWAMTGAFFVSQPVPSLGHSAHGAWAVTAGHVDNTDLFVEHIGPDGASVLEGERFVPCKVREERIRVKGAADVVERVLVTPRGPIVGPAIGESKDALSMRATWMAARPVGAYATIFRARDVDELCACFSSYPTLSESRIFADVGGRIAWQMTGDAPIRRGFHGLVPAPGWDPRIGWEDAVREALPGERDPARGWVATANQCPPGHDAAKDGFLGVDWLDDYRYARIAERLDDRSDWSVEACQRLQLDRVSILWREVKDAVLEAGRAAPPGSDAATATRLLETWDGDLAPSSAAASVFVVALAELMVRIGRAAAPNAWRSALGTGINGVLPHGAMALRRWSDLSRRLRDPSRVSAALVRDALADAVSRLRRRGGPEPNRWAWGTVRPLRLVHPVAEKPPLDRIYSLPPIAVGGDFTTIPQASIDVHDPLGNPVGVANLRGVIDVGAWESSRWSLAGGQSGNPCSPHFGDLLPVWERGEGVSIAWSPESVARRARATLRLRPSSP